MTTISDVARMAGVSISTVSYSVTGTRPISAATRERIEKAMRDLGYTPNALARGLKSKRSRIIALSFPSQTANIDLTGLEYILAASNHAQELNYHLLLWTTEVNAPADLRELVRQGLVEGVLMLQVKLQDQRIKVLTDAGLPFAMIGRPAEVDGLDFVGTDFDQCARVAVKHLFDLGHRNIGFVNHPLDTVDKGLGGPVRVQAALTRATKKAGMSVITLFCQNSQEAGKEAFQNFLDRDPNITAVICLNEQTAPGIMDGALDHGWRIPADFSVVSILMASQVAQMSTPPMTTVSASAIEICRVGVEMLIRRLDGATDAPIQQLIPGELVVRGTSAAVRS